MAPGLRADSAAARFYAHRHAVDLLLRRLDGDEAAPFEIAADYDLVIRESTAGQR